MSGVSRSSPVPLYRQIHSHLADAIDGGELEQGAMLSELDVARRFEVSRVTSRQALAQLEREGRVVRVQGKGTFVTGRPKAEPLSALTSFTENMRAVGRQPSYRTLGIATIPAGEELAAALEVDVESSVLRIERLLYADALPMALMRAFLPPRVHAREPSWWSPERLDATSLYAILERDLGIALWKAQETVEAVTAGADADLLEIASDALVLSVWRRTWDRESRVVEYTNLLYRGDLYRYQVELFRSADGRPR